MHAKPTPSTPNQPRVPAYRLHKPSGKAVVTLSGRDIYLGEHGTPESRARYDRLIAEWLANGRRLPTEPGSTGASEPTLSVAELVLTYVKHCEAKYAARRNADAIVARIKSTLRALREHCGLIAAEHFGPRTFKALRDRWIAAGLSRKTVNENATIVRRAFAWAVSDELLPPSVYHGLLSVASLRRGDSTAAEPRRVKPVADEWVDAVKPCVSRQVWAMVEVQRRTGMRPGEVCIMRTRDLDTSGSVWLYRPATHKTEELHGIERTVALGPAAQAIVKPWLRMNVDEYLFQPREAEAERRVAMHEARRTPLHLGNRPGTHCKRRPKRTPRERYDVDTYRRAIERASDNADRAARIAAGQPTCPTCDGRGFVQPDSEKPRATTRCKACDGSGRVGERLIQRWHPHQLRHSVATRIAKEFGTEAARVMLGHASLDVTTLYAERDTSIALKVAQAIG